jgi:hypothetical protein
MLYFRKNCYPLSVPSIMTDMASTSTPRKRKRSKRPGYKRPFNSNKIAWFLLAFLAVSLLAIKYFNW